MQVIREGFLHTLPEALPSALHAGQRYGIGMSSAISVPSGGTVNAKGAELGFAHSHSAVNPYMGL